MAIFVAANEFVAAIEQCPECVMPMTVTLSDVSDVVVKEAANGPQDDVVSSPPMVAQTL